MKQFLSLALVGLLLVAFASCQRKAKQSAAAVSKPLPNGYTAWVAFYNVENLFDPYDDPGKDDSEYLPGGELGWDADVYLQKLDNLAQAVMSMNNGKGPDLLGLAEVENEQALSDWVKMTALKSRGYAYVIEEGPDPRGIDNAFIYDPEVFAYHSHRTYEVAFPQEPDYVSRLILRVDGSLDGEPVHVLVNHWPSRYGGAEESEPRRLAAATTVKGIVADLREASEDVNILVMGDFNDDPFNRSLTEILETQSTLATLAEDGLFNPWQNLHVPDSVGTLTYRGKWNLFDQILLSEDLLDEEGELYYLPGSLGIHRPEFMQVGGDGPAKDMPRRAIYRGEFQERGFSDHFPVFVRIRVR